MADGMEEGSVMSHQEAISHAKKMTIGDLSAWLTEHGQEEVVYNLKCKKAKKDEFVSAYMSANS